MRTPKYPISMTGSLNKLIQNNSEQEYFHWINCVQCLNQIIINKANFSKNNNHSYDNQISLSFFAIEKNRLEDSNIHGIVEEKPVGAVLMKGAAMCIRCTSLFCECLYSYDGELEKIYE